MEAIVLQNILIVDDEQIEREGLKYLIDQRYRACIYLASGGTQALEIIKDKPFDIMITDIRMPNMDGLELASKAREMSDRLQILLYSGYSDFEYAQKAIKLQVKAYILKPLNKDALYEELDSILEFKDTISNNEKPLDVVECAKVFITKHFAEDISLVGIAKAAYVTPNYLSYIFKLKTGMTPMHYLTAYRMKRAKMLLENTDLKITDIMQACGFSSSSYFSTLFKSEYGYTPTGYREQAVKGETK